MEQWPDSAGKQWAETPVEQWADAPMEQWAEAPVEQWIKSTVEVDNLSLNLIGTSWKQEKTGRRTINTVHHWNLKLFKKIL